MGLSLALAPALLTLGLVRWRLSASWTDFVPSRWDDQVEQWHQILTFTVAGFHGGYYNVQEQPAPWRFFRFSVHGPAFPVLYGSLARVTGWDYATPIALNAALLGAALSWFALGSRLDAKQALAAGLLMLTTWPVLMYLPTSSQEPLHQTLAIVMAALARPLLSATPPSRGAAFAFPLVAGAAALVRISWGLLLIPWALAPGLKQPRWLRLSAAAVILAAALAFSRMASAPGQSSVIAGVSLVARSPGQGLRALFDTAAANLAGLGVPAYALPRAAALVALLFAGGCAGLWLKRRAAARAEAAFHGLNVGLVLLACVVLYLPGGFDRVLAPHLLLSGLVLVSARRLAVVAALVAVNLASLPGFLSSYERWRPNFHVNRRALERDRRVLHSLLRYAPGEDPWCNTVLVDVQLYSRSVAGVPGGLGISTLLSPDSLGAAPRSAHLLVVTESEERLRRRFPNAGLELVNRFPWGSLLKNGSSACAGQARPP